MAASLEVGGWRAELEGLPARFGRLCVRPEPRQQAGRHLEGLLGPVERSDAWLPENKRLALRYDRLGFVVQPLLQAACLFLVAERVVREL